MELSAQSEIFQSTHPLRGGTNDIFAAFTSTNISIHPPLAGWDDLPCAALYSFTISIHPPLAGWDDGSIPFLHVLDIFQSTHPLRGGTYLLQIVVLRSLFQSTHPLRGGTGKPLAPHRTDHISIHPPLAGWDWAGNVAKLFGDIFQSTHATAWPALDAFQSTHPLRGGTGQRKT